LRGVAPSARRHRGWSGEVIARDNGTYAMVAMDQRESLRTMFREHGHDDSDARMRMFKTAVARELAPYASGFLIEPQFLDDVRAFVPRGLILAVDLLQQERGGIVEDTRLDEIEAVPDGVSALKLLVIWRDDDRRRQRIEMCERFVDLARRLGVLSVLEPVVREDDQIEQAARELGATRPSLYKCQAPRRGDVVARCRAITAALPVPWVVLSQGVPFDEFPRAVEQACKGGARGFLAGRALWTNALAADDPTELLRTQSVRRLQELSAIVDRYA
jgi:sulfofructosephosphate aldolase